MIFEENKLKEHGDTLNIVLAKEEALVGARNEHALDVSEYGNFNPVDKGVVSAISGNPI